MAITYLDEKPKSKITYLDEPLKSANPEAVKKKPNAWDISSEMAFNPLHLSSASSDNEQAKKKTLWKALGAEITPEMTSEHPILSSVAKTGQDVATIPAHFFNQRLFNYPRSLLNKAGISYPETDNPVANVAAKTSGVVGGVGSPIGKAIGLFKIGKTMGVGIGKKMLEGAAKGAVAGAAYSPDDITDVKARAGQAAGGAAFGALAEPVIQGTKFGVRTTRKFITNSKKGKLSNPTLLANSGERIKTASKELTDLANKANTVQVEKNRVQAEASVSKIDQQIQNAKTKLEKQIYDYKALSEKKINDALQEHKIISELSARDAKPKVIKFNRANSESYGKEIDKISDVVGEVDSNDVLGMIDKVENNFIEQGIDTSILKGLKNKYKLEGPMPRMSYPFKEVKGDISNISNQLSSKAKTQARYNSGDDLIIANLRKEFADYASEASPEYAELQKTYRPIIQAMNDLSAKFKPNLEFDVTSGSKLLRDIAQQKINPSGKGATIGQKDIIQMLEEGVPGFAKGQGPISYPTTRAYGKVEGLRKSSEKVIRQISKTGESEKLSLSKMLEEAKQSGKIKESELSKALESRKQDISTQVQKGEDVLSRRKNKLELLASKRKVGDRIKGALGGTGILAYLAHRAIANKIFNRQQR